MAYQALTAKALRAGQVERNIVAGMEITLLCRNPFSTPKAEARYALQSLDKFTMIHDHWETYATLQKAQAVARALYTLYFAQAQSDLLKSAHNDDS